MKGKSVKMSSREWKRIQAAAEMSGESCNSFVRRASYQKAIMVFIERNLRILENLVGDAFDNYIFKMEKNFKALENEANNVE